MIPIGRLLQQNSYSSQLQTEEWRNYSQEVRTAHGGACRNCRRKDVQLQVHHVFYDPEKKPWEYDHADVVVLCRGCHKEFHHQLNMFRKHVFRHLRPEHLRVLNGAIAVGMTYHDPLKLVYAIAEMCSSPSSVERFANAWKPNRPVAADCSPTGTGANV